MNSAWFYPLIVLAGAPHALGNTMNAQLRNSLVTRWLASAVSFARTLAFFACAFTICPRPLPSLEMRIAGALLMVLGVFLISKF